VLPDGTILDTLTTLRKDNTGYDLKQLFIGSEGTLGVVTAVALLCPPRPSSLQVAYLACPSFEAVTQVLAVARRCLGEILSAVEFLDRDSLELTLQYLPGTRDPLPASSAPFYVVLETSGSDSSHDVAKFEKFIETAMQEGCVADGTLAQDTSQAAGIWRIREGITEALRHRGAIYKYDISMPVDKMYALVEETRNRLDALFSEGSLDPATHAVGDHARLRVVGYGHLGDGNLHLNVSAPAYDDRLREALEPFVYEWTAGVRGSVSAEHGLGAMKADAIGYSKSPEAVALMRKIKEAIDPHGIMNPYKVLPPIQHTCTGKAPKLNE
jgi:D-2-hydroxyglutarate dehydrogenase